MRAVFTDAQHTCAFLTLDADDTFAGERGPGTWALHEAATADLIASGLMPAAYEAPPAPPRAATAARLYAVMTPDQVAAWDKSVEGSKLAYRAYWFAHYGDAIPETNAKVVRIAQAAGLDLEALYDAALKGA